jgi:outer membrane immunogenic protein
MGAWSRVVCAAIAMSVAKIACAGAADLEVSARPPMAFGAPLRFFSWSGCYLGGHLGWALADNNITGTFLAPTGPLNNPTFVNVADTVPINFGSNGFLIGGQGGCNLEFTNRLVIGFEADAAWVNASADVQQTFSGNVPGPFGFPTTANTSGTLTTRIDFIATATARIGYAFGSFGRGLIYGKGGAAWIGDRSNFTGQVLSTACADPQCLTSANFVTLFNSTNRETRAGWTIGAGVEWAMVGNWTIKGEYNYLDFGTRTVTLTDPVLGPTTVSLRQTVNEVKFGVNYRFAAPFGSSYY